MSYLLDVNTLVAWGWADHEHDERVDRWLGSLQAQPGDSVMTSAVPQLGFIRVSVQRGQGTVTLDQANQVLEGLLQSVGTLHEFLPDDQPVGVWPSWCLGAARTTDAHLFRLATAHGAQLATLDQGLPGAFLIP